ncbi:MAG: hypothetical protein ABSA39_14300 [Edaphobacter sp.]
MPYGEIGVGLPRNQYTAIRDDKPKSTDEAKRSEFKVCKFTTDAIITEGSDVGTVHKVCANPACSVHHPKQQTKHADASYKAEQEKERREAAIASTTSIRVFEAITAAVPVRLMKRDLLFIAERLVSLMDENRLVAVARQHGIKKAKDNDSIGKLFVVYLLPTLGVAPEKQERLCPPTRRAWCVPQYDVHFIGKLSV